MHSSHPASVSSVSVSPLNSTAVNVSWTPINLTVVDHYTVHYVAVGGGSERRRRRKLHDLESVSFHATASSGVVPGLMGGLQYQFSITVTLNVSGELFNGALNFSESSIVRELQHNRAACSILVLLSLRAATTSSSGTSDISDHNHCLSNAWVAYISLQRTRACMYSCFLRVSNSSRDCNIWWFDWQCN